MAETMPASEFRRRLDRFYATANAVVFDHDGSLDKFIGDELMAMFYPLLTGPNHPAQAVAAAAGLASGLERRSLDLKGKSAPIDVQVVTVASPTVAV